MLKVELAKHSVVSVLLGISKALSAVKGLTSQICAGLKKELCGYYLHAPEIAFHFAQSLYLSSSSLSFFFLLILLSLNSEFKPAHQHTVKRT